METRRHARRPTKPNRAILKCLEHHKQKLQRFARDKKEAIRTEITRLLAVGFIKEVYHPDWLANPILVRKKNNEGENVR